jgi:Protein of unknown function (DUF4242)
MAVYMVERELPGITPEQLARAQEAAIWTSREFTSGGRPVRYLRSTFLPDDSRCFCLFEAPTRQLVRELNETARLPFIRIVEALDLTPVVAMLVFGLSMLAVGCGRNPIAPGADTGPAAVAQAQTSARSSAACSNVDATVVATLSGVTASGTIAGDINGSVSAAIHQVDPSGNSNAGALHVLMEHHYTNVSPFGRIDTSDHAVLAPIDPAAGLYRMNNRLTVVGGAGIYAGATGYIHTHGKVDLGTGAINLSLKGRVCAGS